VGFAGCQELHADQIQTALASFLIQQGLGGRK
jgi:hypothetical protein